ncbi:hypothetical protein Pd630_LPD10029 (plasmid) [Rhodococcus opacus PD630]|nr:hypothetical protein Pd630_LPD10029 [Rhodococcus opacus PD630]
MSITARRLVTKRRGLRRTPVPQPGKSARALMPLAICLRESDLWCTSYPSDVAPVADDRGVV